MGHLAGQGDCPSRWSEFRRPRGGGWGRPRRGRADEPARRCVESPARGQGGEPSGGWVGTQGRPGCSPPRPHHGGIVGAEPWSAFREDGAVGGGSAEQSRRAWGRHWDPPRLVHLSPLLGPAPGTRLAGTRSRSRLSERGAQSPGLRPGAHLPFAWVSPLGPAASAECKGPERVSPASGWRPGWRYHPDRWQTPLQGGEKVYRQPIQGKRPRTAKPWGPQQGSPDPRPDRPRRVQCGTPARGLGCTRGP